MPRAKKETQAEITQRTMEEMQTQLAQLTQAMQGLLAQRNIPAAAQVEENSPIMKTMQTHSWFLEKIDQELNQLNLTTNGNGALNLKYQSSMEARSRKISLTGSPR